MSIFQENLNKALPKAYFVALKILHNQEQSRDACQEAALKAWSAKDSYKETQPFYPWFYRILQNHCFDRLKENKKEHWVEEEDVSDCKPSPESHFLGREQQQVIAKAIGLLPQELREIIELRHFQELNYDEIAEIAEIPVGTVMSRLYRARKALREILQNDLQYSFQKGELK